MLGGVILGLDDALDDAHPVTTNNKQQTTNNNTVCGASRCSFLPSSARDTELPAAFVRRPKWQTDTIGHFFVVRGHFHPRTHMPSLASHPTPTQSMCATRTTHTHTHTNTPAILAHPPWSISNTHTRRGGETPPRMVPRQPGPRLPPSHSGTPLVLDISGSSEARFTRTRSTSMRGYRCAHSTRMHIAHINVPIHYLVG